MVAEREYYRKKWLQGLQQVINELCKKRKARQALWTAEGGKHMFLVFCFSAEVLRKLRGEEGTERPTQMGLAKDTTGGNEGRAPGWLAAHHETAPHLMVSVWFRRRGADKWETQGG